MRRIIFPSFSIIIIDNNQGHRILFDISLSAVRVRVLVI